MHTTRKTKPWYKIWKAIFKTYLYLCLFLTVGYVASRVVDTIEEVLILPFYLTLFSTPLFLISFVALYIMREDDRERDRIREYRIQNKEKDT